MNFDMKKFEKNLQKHRVNELQEKKRSSTSGEAYAVSQIWNHERISNIDFDAFTLDDVHSVYEMMEFLPADRDEDDDEMFITDPNNPFMIVMAQGEAVGSLCNYKNKVYLYDEEDSFI